MSDTPDPFTPTGADAVPVPDAAAFRAARRSLLELMESLPETRLSTGTPRHGWTLRHELSWLAAADLEVMTRIQMAREESHPEPHWRRLRGEAMHLAQEMRLHALREHLSETGEQAATTLEAHAEMIGHADVRAALLEHVRATASATEAVAKIVSR